MAHPGGAACRRAHGSLRDNRNPGHAATHYDNNVAAEPDQPGSAQLFGPDAGYDDIHRTAANHIDHNDCCAAFHHHAYHNHYHDYGAGDHNKHHRHSDHHCGARSV